MNRNDRAFIIDGERLNTFLSQLTDCIEKGYIDRCNAISLVYSFVDDKDEAENPIEAQMYDWIEETESLAEAN